MKKIIALLSKLDVRGRLFFLLGFLCGLYLFFPFKIGIPHHIEVYIRFISIFFGIIYLFAYIFIFSCIEFLKRVFRRIMSREEKKEAVIGTHLMSDILVYYLGGLSGLILFVLSGLIGLAGFGLFHLFKLIF